MTPVFNPGVSLWKKLFWGLKCAESAKRVTQNTQFPEGIIKVTDG